MPSTPPVNVTQARSRFYADNGTESGSTPLAAENANINLALGSVFLLRFNLTNQVMPITDTFQLQYNKNGAGNVNVNGASSVVRSNASAFVADGTPTTQRLSETSVNFAPGVVDTVDGLSSSITLTPSLGFLGATEVVFCCVLRASDSVVGDSIVFRLVDGAGTVLILYQCFPTITCTAAIVPPPSYCWTLTGTSATIDNPDSGALLLLKGLTWGGTNTVVSVILDKLLVTCSAKGGAATPANLLVALTTKGDYNQPATTFHSVALTADGAQRSVAPIDFTSEIVLATVDLQSGLIGIIVTFDAPFTNCEVTISGGRIMLGQSSSSLGSGAYGLVYGEIPGCDEYLAVIGSGAFTENGQFVDHASANNWSNNLSPNNPLMASVWNGAPFLGEFFITNPDQGVFRRKVCSDAFHFLEPLYLNYVNPGSSGGITLNIVPPPYVVLPFDHVADSLTGTAGITAYHGFPTAPTANIDPNTNLPTIHITNPNSSTLPWFVEIEIQLPTPNAVDMSKMPYLALHFTTSTTLNGNEGSTRMGFGATLSNYTIRLGNAATGQYAGAAIQAQAIQTPADPSNLSHYVWFDLQAIQGHPILGGVSLIRIRIPTQAFSLGYYYLKEFIMGGEFYHHNPPVTMLPASPSDDTKSGGPLVYAWNYTEGSVPAAAQNAHTVSVPAATHMGLQSQTSLPYNGSLVNITVPIAPTPFDGLAVQHLYRKIGANFYQIVQSADNTNDLIYTDCLSDFTILNSYTLTASGITTGPSFGDTYTNNGHTFTIISAPAAGAGPIVATGTGVPAASGNLTRTSGTGDASIAFSAFVSTYPLSTLNFGAITASGSGQVTGVVNICEWKGSLLYFLSGGSAAGSESNIAQNVLWPGVVLDLTGIDPSAVPRTLQITANGLPILVGVGGAVLYMWSRKEGYTMRSLTTFAQADFPSKMDGVRGVVSTKAACAYDAGALFGSDDGLWYVAVNPFNPTVATAPPDLLVEVTKNNRGLWARMIGDQSQRANLVVRTTGQDIWAFCQGRYIHISRNQNLSYGEWTGSKIVADAWGDPRRGVTVLFSDGTFGVCGEYLTDGGTNAAGDNGTSPSWRWRGKRHCSPRKLIAARAVFESKNGQTSVVAISAFTAKGSDIIPFTDSRGNAQTPFDTTIMPAADWFEIEISGGAGDAVTRAEITVADADPLKIPRV